MAVLACLATKSGMLEVQNATFSNNGTTNVPQEQIEGFRQEGSGSSSPAFCPEVWAQAETGFGAQLTSTSIHAKQLVFITNTCLLLNAILI